MKARVAVALEGESRLKIQKEMGEQIVLPTNVPRKGIDRTKTNLRNPKIA